MDQNISSEQIDSSSIQKPIKQDEFQFKVPSAKKILKKKRYSTSGTKTEDDYKNVGHISKPGNVKKSSSKSLKMRSGVDSVISKCILWPNDKSQAVKIFARNNSKLHNRVRKLVETINNIEADKQLCTCRGLITVTDRVIFHQKTINAKFTFNSKYPEISVNWLRDRATLTTREFIGEIIGRLSKQGNLDESKKTFIIGKINEKYSEFEEPYRNCNVSFAAKHLNQMYTTPS